MRLPLQLFVSSLGWWFISVTFYTVHLLSVAMWIKCVFVQAMLVVGGDFSFVVVCMFWFSYVCPYGCP